MQLSFKWINDDVCAVYLNGNHIITMNHDDHGWDGMKGIRDTLIRAGNIAGWKINTIGSPGIR